MHLNEVINNSQGVPGYIFPRRCGQEVGLVVADKADQSSKGVLDRTLSAPSAGDLCETMDTRPGEAMVS